MAPPCPMPTKVRASVQAAAERKSLDAPLGRRSVTVLAQSSQRIRACCGLLLPIKSFDNGCLTLKMSQCRVTTPQDGHRH